MWVTPVIPVILLIPVIPVMLVIPVILVVAVILVIPFILVTSVIPVVLVTLFIPVIPVLCWTCQLANEIGFFKGFLLKNHLLRQRAKKVMSDSPGQVAILFLTCTMGKWCFLNNSNNRRIILLIKKFLRLVEMMSVLVNASFSLPEWEDVKMIFFAPCSCIPFRIWLISLNSFDWNWNSHYDGNGLASKFWQMESAISHSSHPGLPSQSSHSSCIFWAVQCIYQYVYFFLFFTVFYLLDSGRLL